MNQRIPHTGDDGREGLATAERLHELLEASGLRLRGSGAADLGLVHRLRRGHHLALGQIPGAVLELGLSRTGGRRHIPVTPGPGPRRGQRAGDVLPTLLGLLDRRSRGLSGV